MRIVILCGGSGSVALQRGLHSSLDARLDGVETRVLVNAYDNGFSTGAVRQVMDGKILGPSDVRKNQSTQLSLINPESPWLKALNCRFTVIRSQAHEYCLETAQQLIRRLDNPEASEKMLPVLFGAIEEYFAAPLASQIDYDDFSFGNILYAGLARAKGYSLRAAARVMASAMGIRDHVILNDDRSLFLGAITRSGRRVSDEGEIVFWDNADDPFMDLFFSQPDGREGKPHLCLEAWKALTEADLIILSSGTQWSSLIPTYASEGFKAAIEASGAKVLMVMNRIPDRDSPGQTASDIINTLVPRYFDAGRLHVITDVNSHSKMQRLDSGARAKVASIKAAVLSTKSEAPEKHSAAKLAEAIGAAFFQEYLDSDVFLFDYDDTLVSRGNRYPSSSRFNIRSLSKLNGLTDIGICTGNTIRAVSLGGDADVSAHECERNGKPVRVFADGGVNEYRYGQNFALSSQSTQCIWPDALLPATGPFSAAAIIESLCAVGIPESIIENRGGVCIAIKPVEHAYRRALVGLIRHLLKDSRLEVREVGKTTVEICKPSVSKIYALNHLRASSERTLRVTYVGDELESGNDVDIRKLACEESALKCLHVEGPAKTAFFISTLMTHLTRPLNADLYIVAAGKGSRLNANVPKALIPIVDEPCLTTTLQQIGYKFRKVFVITNELVSEQWERYCSSLEASYPELASNTVNVPISSGLGDGHATLQGLIAAEKLKDPALCDDVVIVWGDVFIPHSELVDELMAVDAHKGAAVLPAVYEANPYVALVVDEKMNCVAADFSKHGEHNPVGFHDQSIFRFDRKRLKASLTSLHHSLWKDSRYITPGDELSLLHTFHHLYNSGEPAYVYETAYPTLTFNTIEEVISIQRDISSRWRVSLGREVSGYDLRDEKR